MNVPPTAVHLGLVSCPVCRLLCEAGSLSMGRMRCPRCGARLRPRKPDAQTRSTALLVAAVLLYVPANTLPVMTVTTLGRSEPNTILSGVKALVAAGTWPLALIVFFASFVVPVVKMLVLSYLLASVRRGSRWRLRDRARLYRVTEAIGRWSMIDVYVVSILVALVKAGAIADIEPGPGAIAFAAVVILTMLAAAAFDPRLMWDAAERWEARR